MLSIRWQDGIDACPPEMATTDTVNALAGTHGASTEALREL